MKALESSKKKITRKLIKLALIGAVLDKDLRRALIVAVPVGMAVMHMAASKKKCILS